MNNTKRVGINTMAQYIRTVFNMILALYTVRIVLNTLGASDYGIYTVIAGVTSMLAFITNALTSTTQRFMSFYQGKKDVAKMKEVFSNSEFIHLGVGVFFLVLLFLLQPLLFDGFLNIPVERVYAAQKVYFIVGCILFTTFCTAPFRALLISHENIVYISIIEVLDAVMKVIMVLFLPYIPFDKLIVYVLILLLLQILNLLFFATYTFRKYEECILPRTSLINVSYIRELISYAGWTIYGMGCVIGRTQGIAILINRFLNTVVNAAYGIGFQLSASVSTISTAFLNAMRPQIVKAEGGNDRDRSIRLSQMLCKFSFFLMTALCVPCVFEMPTLLSLWIKDVPEYTVLFARMALIAGMVDTLTLGLSVLNEAIGKIRNYNIVIASTKLMALPLACFFLLKGLDPFWIAFAYVFAECVSVFIRIPFAKKSAGLDVSIFVKDVLVKESVPLLLMLAINFVIVTYINIPFRFLVTFGLSLIAYTIFFYIIGLSSFEKGHIIKLIKSKSNHE